MRRKALLTLTLALACGGNDGPPIVPAELEPIEWFGEEAAALPYLEPPLSAQETQDLRRAFSWEATESLPETDAEGRPALHYVMVYVRSDDELDLLEQLVPSSTLPLFESERERWRGQTGVLHNRGDIEGLFRFAVLPAAIFNELRDLALTGNAPFAAIVGRDAPAEAVMADGTLSYSYLAEHGFHYGPRPLAASSDDEVGSRDDSLLVELIALIVSSRDVRDGVDDALSEIGHAARGSAFISVSLEVLNTDWLFGNGRQGAGMEPADRTWTPSRLRPMQRAWGPGRGNPMTLPNVEVVAQGDLGTERARTDRNGAVVLEVVDGFTYDLCLRMENHAGGLSEGFHSLQFCEFGAELGPNNEDIRVTDGDTFVRRLRVLDWRANVLAQMTDSFDLTDQVFTHRIGRAAKVLVGPLADLVGELNGGRAVAICGGFDGLTLLHLVPTVLAAIEVVPIPSAIVAPLAVVVTQILTNDIIFPFSGPFGATADRLTPTHEYGHYVMCDMIARQSSDDFHEAHFDLVYTLIGSGEDFQTPEQSNLVFTEAWADFFASRVAGGTDYFELPGDDPTAAGRGGGRGWWIDSDYPWALEDNIGGRTQRAMDSDVGDPFAVSVARFVTLLHDAFDGPSTVVMQSGAYWTWNEADRIFELGPVGRDQEDERVTLPGSAVADLYRNWARRYSTVGERHFASALATTMVQHGYSETEICEVFALHSAEGDCTELLDDDALDLSATAPGAPEIVDVSVEEDALEWRFFDLSPRGTSHEYVLEGDDGTRRNGTLPFRRTQTLRVTGLDADQRYVLRLSTRNDGTDGPEIVDEQVTLAERVPSIAALAGRGRVQLTWDPTVASGYVVEELRDGVAHHVAETARSTVELTGLADETLAFQVVSKNRIGVRSEPSSAVFVRPMAPNRIYVAPDGNDGAVDAGSPGSPYRTCDAALGAARADASIDAVWFAVGTYGCGDHRVSEDLLLEGGFTRSGSSWTPATEDSTVLSFTGAGTDHGACGISGPGGFNPSRLMTNAGLVVAANTTLIVRSLTAYRQGSAAASRCTSVMHADGGTLRLEDAAAINEVTSGDCRVGVSGHGGSGVVEVIDSDVRASASGSTASRHYAGICAAQQARLRVDGSTVAGRDVLAGGSNPASLIGVLSRDVAEVRVTRSTVIASRSTGVLDGRLLSALVAEGSGGLLVVDNSHLATPVGGRVNRPVDVRGAPRGVYLYFVTAVAGNDWDSSSAVASDFTGSVLSFEGDLSGASVVVLSSILANGLGRNPAETSSYSLVDRRAATTDPATLRFQGNLLSLYFPPAASSSAIHGVLLCGNGEFDRVVTEVGINTVTEHDCRRRGLDSLASWRVGANELVTEIYGTPGLCMGECAPGTYCSFRARCEPRPTEAVVQIGTDGYPYPVDVPFVFNQTGAAASDAPHASEIQRDRSGRMRAITRRQGAGAHLRR
ncbi:MAG: fibronectin type III domain-containing protein [Deltaproteobacteria bacterium]|nr:fibronectin type III domain-containing protein [Deltaproteobacteria bacterium]